MNDTLHKSGADQSAESSPRLTRVRKLMNQFDDLPPQVREALSSSDEPSDQMLEVLCTMHESGFPVEALLKVIAANNAKSGAD